MDIVERLQDLLEAAEHDHGESMSFATYLSDATVGDIKRANDEILRLRSDNERMREALWSTAVDWRMRSVPLSPRYRGRTMAEIDPRIAQAVRDQLSRQIDDMLLGGLQTSCVPTPENTLTTEKLRAMVEDVEKLVRNARRSQITVVVDLAHEGPILLYTTPSDGDRFEMSWHQANELHKHWPIKLHKVNSPEQAEFVFAYGVFPEWMPRHLPMPPYEMPPDEDCDTWLSQGQGEG